MYTRTALRNGAYTAFKWFLLLLALAGFLIAAHRHLDAGAVPGNVPVMQYVVQPNETAWTIAEKADPTYDPRSVTDWIAMHNHLSDGQALMPGEHILIPKG